MKLEDLRADFKGTLLKPDDAVHVNGVRLFNRRFQGRPALIAQPSDSEDVAAAVRFARDNGLAPGILGGGHNPAGSAIADGGLVIDMTRLGAVSVDVTRHMVTVGGGARWKQVDEATMVHGLATPGGDCCVVGVAGYVLGGGHGMLSRAHGLGCDNLVAATLVDAAGDVVRVSETEEPELFWALRGGGNGNFGVVTEMDLRLRPLSDDLYGGALVWPWAYAGVVVRCFRDLFAGRPTDDLTLAMNLARFPFPDGEPTVTVYGAHLGGAQAAERDMAAFRRIGPPMIDIFGPTGYLQMQTLSEDDITGPGQGLRGLWKGGFVEDDLDDGAIESIIAAFAAAPSPASRIHFDLAGGGAIARVDRSATAFWHRRANFNVEVLALWRDAADDMANMDWARWAKADLAGPLGGGVYVGYGDPELQDWAAAYYGGNCERLVAAKRRYDPDNLFRFPQGLSEVQGAGHGES